MNTTQFVPYYRKIDAQSVFDNFSKDLNGCGELMKTLMMKICLPPQRTLCHAVEVEVKQLG